MSETFNRIDSLQNLMIKEKPSQRTNRPKICVTTFTVCYANFSKLMRTYMKSTFHCEY